MENLLLTVAGMHTAACADKIQKTLSAVRGVESVSVNFSAERASLSYDELTVDEKKIMKTIEKLGYKAKKHVDENEELKSSKSLIKKQTSKLIIAGVIAAIILFEPVLFVFLPAVPQPAKNILILALVTLLIYIGLFAAIKKTYEDVAALKFRPSVLALAGVTVIYVYTFLLSVAPQISPYINRSFLYQTLAVIVVILIVRKFFELKYEYKLHQNFEKLTALQPKKARLVRHNDETEVDITAVKVGDIIKVKAGEAFPVDGIIIEGETKVNETIVTGAEGFVDKFPGDEVISATLNTQNTVIFKATQVGKETTLSQVISLVNESDKYKGKFEKTAPVIQNTFMVLSFIAALGSVIFWYITGVSSWVFAGIISFAGVMLIACPSGFLTGVQIPIKLGKEKAALRGIVYKGGSTIETAYKIKRIVIDKTGILTKGIPEITNIITKEGFNEKRFLIMIGSLENASTHPFAEAITDYCRQNDVSIKKAYDYKNIEGMGIIGTVDGQEVIAGNMKLMEKSGVQMNKDLLHKAEILSKNVRSPVFVARNRELVGVIGIADTIKENAKTAIANLNNKGFKLTLVTGDNEAIAKNIGDELRIKDVSADLQQKEKIEVLQDFQEKEIVAFVGHGINDGPVLAQADVGIAMGTGTDTALASSDITCLSDDLNKINEALEYARKVKKTASQNLMLMFTYNIILIPVAFGAFYPLIPYMFHPALAPLFAGAAQLLIMRRSIKNI